MTSGSTREFMALMAIAQHFGRPGTPTDHAWIESLFGHVKAEWPHLLIIADPALLRAELAVVRRHYNGIRLHSGIGYVTPDDEHDCRGPAIRKAIRRFAIAGTADECAELIQRVLDLGFRSVSVNLAAPRPESLYVGLRETVVGSADLLSILKAR
jgi:alkanesulfonate monooxygenase SsuD/methylene tetrahydromethanopterin reductase-like flavin-dependent oxidoreductase (luciferase family)